MTKETKNHPRPQHEIAYERAFEEGKFNRYTKGTLLVMLGDTFIGAASSSEEIMQLPEVRDPNRELSPVIYTWEAPTVSYQPYRDIR